MRLIGRGVTSITPVLHQLYTLLTQNVFGSTRAFPERSKAWNFCSGNNKKRLGAAQTCPGLVRPSKKHNQ